ncbi:hypothetical protein AB5L52_28945 [Streptomyces sp. CG4]
MTMPYADGNGPLIPKPELTLPVLRQAVAMAVREAGVIVRAARREVAGR